MPATFLERQAKLGNIVLSVLPKVLQTILKEYISPRGLQMKYSLKDIRTSLTESEISLMEKLPNMDDFTIELCYKILRFENLMHEPSCKWGNDPKKSEVEIADDIQRILITTNAIISKTCDGVSETEYDNFQQKLQDIFNRVDKYLNTDTCVKLYNTINESKIIYIDILQELTRLQQVHVTEMIDKDIENRDRYSRVSFVAIDTFPSILRDIIRPISPPNQMYQMCLQHMLIFLPDQQKSLQELQSSNSYDAVDITLIYKLLRQFSLIHPPSKGWGNVPDELDTKIADDVERIRHFRNQLAHRCNPNIGKDEFDDYFDKFRVIGQRMDHYFSQNTNYEYKITGHKTCRMDLVMQTKYENALKELENIKLRYEKKPIKYFWGDNFERSLKNLRSLLKEEQSIGTGNVRVQIFLQNMADVERAVDILNSLKDEINEGLNGIEFVVAAKGSIVLDVDIQQEMMKTDEILQTTLTLFFGKILKYISTSETKSVDVVLIPKEEYPQWKKFKTLGETVFLEFDIEAQLFETDNEMEKQLEKISKVICKHSNGSGANNNITATLLPISLENIPPTEEALAQAQTPVKVIYSLPVSVMFHQQFNCAKSKYNVYKFFDCLKIGNTLVLSDHYNKQLITYNSNGTYIDCISLFLKPLYMTEVDIDTVAVSCGVYRKVLIVKVSTGEIATAFKTRGYCSGISYKYNNLYVVIENRTIHVMNLRGTVKRSIPSPSDCTLDININRDRLVCNSSTSIYCCSFDGKLMWKFKNYQYKSFRHVTTDDKKNVYLIDYNTSTAIVLSGDGKHYREIVTESDGLNKPMGIHFDLKENILSLCNQFDAKVFLFDVKEKQE